MPSCLFDFLLIVRVDFVGVPESLGSFEALRCEDLQCFLLLVHPFSEGFDFSRKSCTILGSVRNKTIRKRYHTAAELFLSVRYLAAVCRASCSSFSFAATLASIASFSSACLASCSVYFSVMAERTSANTVAFWENVEMYASSSFLFFATV
jgi:hypothetical protein